MALLLPRNVGITPLTASKNVLLPSLSIQIDQLVLFSWKYKSRLVPFWRVFCLLLVIHVVIDLVEVVYL